MGLSIALRISKITIVKAQILLLPPFNLSPIYIKSESNFQIFHSETIASLEMGAKGQISLVQLLKGDRPIVHWSNENILVI